MEIRETLARIFRKKATDPQPQSPTESQQELGPGAKDRLARIRQRNEQQKLAELAHIADRFQRDQEVVSPPPTTPEATSLPAEPSREHLKPGQITEEQRRRLQATVERLKERSQESEVET